MVVIRATSYDYDGARGVNDALLADRPKEEPREATSSTRPHDKHVGVFRPCHQPLSGSALQDGHVHVVRWELPAGLLGRNFGYLLSSLARTRFYRGLARDVLVCF